MLSKSIQEHLQNTLTDHFAHKVSIDSIKPVGGGSINNTYLLKTNAGDLFLKHNSASKYPDMFVVEKTGLDFLRNHSSFNIPQVYFSSLQDDDAFLVMEYIKKGKPAPDYFRQMGKLLADLHRKTNDLFGLDHDNYIGRLHQSNTPSDDWVAFFIQQRLEKQVHEAVDNKAIDVPLARLFQKLYLKLNSIFPKEQPALLHGDLWSGNVMPDADGYPCVFDPAVYYGHREMDIAMTQLFGGFGDDFYESYQEQFPMKKGWEERMDICNLYPLMVHVNLFGGGYVEDVKAILRRFA